MDPITSQDGLNAAFATVNSIIKPLLFFSIFGVPLVVMVLVAGAVFFTIKLSFINFRGFRHAVAVVLGHYDHDSEPGELTHFQALTSALSATIGLGNIAGVAIAISRGGPGAVFWMLVVAFFGMSSKFVSCTLAQMYRKIDSDGNVRGGPMYYLEEGLKKEGHRGLGKVLGIAFAILCIGGAIGGGNMFQANQSREIIASEIPFFSTYPWVYGVLLSSLVGVVIVGGVRQIGQVTAKIVPWMAGIYVFASIAVIFTHLPQVPRVLNSIFTEAFSPDAMWGGFIGVMVVGIQRAAFSNEAGVGSAAIAHASAKTHEPVREGLVAMLGPFVDTIVICLMTAIVVLVANPATSTSDDSIGVYAGITKFVPPNRVVLGGAYPQIEPYDQLIISEAPNYLSNGEHIVKKSGVDPRRNVTIVELLGPIVPSIGGNAEVRRLQGVNITKRAFTSVFPGFGLILMVIVFLFAFSTIISWSHYGEKAWEYLFGHRTSKYFRVVTLVAVVIGSAASLTQVLIFCDMMLLAMAFPNIVGGVLMFDQVKAKLDDYWSRLKNNKMPTAWQRNQKEKNENLH